MKKIITIVILLLLIVGGLFSFQIWNQKNNKKEETKEKETIEKNENSLEDTDIKNSIFKKSYQSAIKTVSKMSLEEKVGQLFLVRYDKTLTNILKNNYPGGYILFAKDFENHTKESMYQELEQLQKNSKYPLIIGVDEEGGFVTRVSRFTEFRSEKFKSPKDYYKEGGYELLEKIEKEKASLLKEIGINLNLAPVADISTNENDFIYSRSFGEDANKTAEYIEKMVEYANNNHINSCLKHFPGYGNNVDTHTGIAIDDREYQSLQQNDFLPFISGIKKNVPSILVSHNIVNSIDSEYPSSLSKKVINILRNELNFTGIIITDDLAMDAVKEYVEDKNAATIAVNAGNDMIITSDFQNMYEEVINSVKNNKIREETLNKAVIRIIAWKYESNLWKGENND